MKPNFQKTKTILTKNEMLKRVEISESQIKKGKVIYQKKVEIQSKKW